MLLHLLCVCGFFSCLSSCAVQPTPPLDWKEQIKAWNSGDPLPPFSLIRQDGSTFSMADYGDTHLLISWVFTRCGVPEACHSTMTRMQEIQAHWQADSNLPPLHLLTLTLDPEHDRPPVLKRYGERYQASFDTWTLATGEPELMKDGLPSLFNVLALPESPAILQHTVKAALLSPGLKPRHQWKDNAFTVQEIVDLAREGQ